MENVFRLMMVKHMFNKSGFTLIETLFVFMIMCMLFVLSFHIHIPQKSDTVKIEEITRFLNQAKMTAMNQKNQVKVIFGADEILYECQDISEKYVLDTQDSFVPYELTFNENGNIHGAKTLTYYCGQHQYHLVFQIGSGSFYVE